MEEIVLDTVIERRLIRSTRESFVQCADFMDDRFYPICKRIQKSISYETRHPEKTHQEIRMLLNEMLEKFIVIYEKSRFYDEHRNLFNSVNVSYTTKDLRRYLEFSMSFGPKETSDYIPDKYAYEVRPFHIWQVNTFSGSKYHVLKPLVEYFYRSITKVLQKSKDAQGLPPDLDVKRSADDDGRIHIRCDLCICVKLGKERND